MLFSKEPKLPQNSTEQLIEANEILKSLSPIVQKLYKNKASQFIGTSFNIITEYALYILGIASIAFVFIMHTVFPFHILGEIMNQKAYKIAISNTGDLQTFNIAIKGLVVTIGVLLIFLGFAKNASRKRKNLLTQAGSELKNIEAMFTIKKQFLDSSIPKTSKDELNAMEPQAVEVLK
jgi:hypothetical protein